MLNKLRSKKMFIIKNYFLFVTIKMQQSAYVYIFYDLKYFKISYFDDTYSYLYHFQNKLPKHIIQMLKQK